MRIYNTTPTKRLLFVIATIVECCFLSSSCKAILFRRSSSKKAQSKKIAIPQPPQNDLPIFPKLTVINPSSIECHNTLSSGSKYSRARKTLGVHVEANRFSESKKVTSIGEEFARKTSDELKPTKIRSKLTNDMMELLFTEFFRGLFDCNSIVTTMPAIAPVRGFLVDLSMSTWIAIQNHHEYKQRSNWQCDDDACELIDASIPTQMESDSIGTSDCQSQLLSSGKVVGLLIPLDTAVPTILSSKSVDAGCSIKSPATTAPGTGPLPLIPSAITIAKYCTTSLLIYLLSHQVAPFFMHSIEDCLGKLAVDVA